MNADLLTCLSPLDGRYVSDIKPLKNIFSEFGLIKYRVLVEIKWIIQLTENPEIQETKQLSATAKKYLNKIYEEFDINDCSRVKQIEQQTKHDVKAVEYFIKEKISNDKELAKVVEFIHFACTSEDINNLAYALMLKEGISEVLIPSMQQLITKITNMSVEYADIAMLSRTHGQSASPTTVGKEMANFAYRLQQPLEELKQVKILGKINGAVGNYNAHSIAYPELDWIAIATKFITNLGITYNPYTTQIEPHDYIANICSSIKRFNNILLDFNRDMWGYISLNYFSQKVVAGEVGSSTMPHKVNPINFENSEGNLGLANALFEHFATKLPVSRWQRDLTDSTVLRNIGISFGYSILAYNSTIKGIDKLKINKQQLDYDLNNSWEVIAEAIQTVMRRYAIDNPYEKLKQLTRGNAKVTKELLHDFIDTLELPATVKQQLKKLNPSNYIGYAASQAKNVGTFLDKV
jgi:adenylosuccinate lyase